MDAKNEINDGIILISKSKRAQRQEELYLQRTGTWAYVFHLMEIEKEDDFELV